MVLIFQDVWNPNLFELQLELFIGLLGKFDEHFIISTGDHYSINWYNDRPTITDDLEKACYIIDGKALPDTTIKNTMRRSKIWESENPYFKIRICKNGNTHYWINDEIRNRLNYFGAKRGIIGQDCKIKIFE